MEYITPRIPPRAQIRNEIQNGNSVHQPIMIKPGSTKMIDDNVPAAEATVCTMLFSCTVALLKIAQDRHRNHRGRDRGRKSQPGFEPEVNVRRRENQRDDHANDEAADREFRALFFAQVEGRVRRSGRIHRRHQLEFGWRKCLALGRGERFREPIATRNRCGRHPVGGVRQIKGTVCFQTSSLPRADAATLRTAKHRPERIGGEFLALAGGIRVVERGCGLLNNASIRRSDHEEWTPPRRPYQAWHRAMERAIHRCEIF